jgi:5-methylcytosine-specific restriction endonuclease McrA
MPVRPPLHHGSAYRSAGEQRRDFDKRRGSARQRGYTTAWQRAREAYLAQHPLCIFCERDGLVTAATVVDHVEAHHGDDARFWDSGNWQSLCKPHHDSTKQRQEKSRPRGAGGQKVHDPSLGTGPLGKLLRPRNWTGGSND